MRRFSLLLLALILALIAQRLLATSDAFISYVLRDSLILTTIAVLIFVANSLSLPTALAQASHKRTSVVSWVLMITGLLCAAVAGTLFVLPVTGVFFEQLRPTLWGVGLLLLALSALGKTAATYALPKARWQKSDLGDFELVPLDLYARQRAAQPKPATSAEAAEPQPPTAPAQRTVSRLLARRTEIGLLLMVLAVGAFLRIGAINSLPTSCLPAECETLLHLAEQPAPSLFATNQTLLALLQSNLVSRMAEDVFALRLAGALLSIFTLLCFYGFARRLASESGALAATALLALSPWHIWATGEPSIATPLFVSLCGWMVLSVWQAETARWPTLAGMGLGIVLALIDEQRSVTALWTFIGLLLGSVMLPAPTLVQRIQRLVLPLLVAAAIASPWLAGGQPDTVQIVTAPSLEPALAGADASARMFTPLLEMAAALFWRGDFGALGPVLDGSLLGVLVGALLLLSIGLLVRTLLRPASIWLGLGILLFTWTILQTEAGLLSAGATASESFDSAISAALLLPLLPLLFGGVALTLDQLLIGFHTHWRRLILPGPATALALLLLSVAMLPALQNLRAQAGSSSSASQSQFDGVLSQYLAENLAQDTATYFVPSASLESRALKVMLGPQLESAMATGRLRGLDASRDLLFPDLSRGAESGLVEPGEVVYLIPTQERPLLDLLLLTFPAGASQPLHDEQSGQPLLTAFRVDAQTLMGSQGLQGSYFLGLDEGANEAADWQEPSRALHFDWSQGTPLETPFTVRWEGALLAPQAGNYRFVFNAGPEAQATLRLDHALVLDSASGVTDRVQSLASGVYRIEIRYTVLPEPTPFAVLWQPPDGAGFGNGLVPIPQAALRNTPLPVMGLLGTYADNSVGQGGPSRLQKDLLVGLDPSISTQERTTSVRWIGKLAAPRAGEYMLAVLTEGDATIRVQGQTVVNKQIALEDAESISYVEGLIYLEAGWHEIEIEYVAAQSVSRDSQPGMRLFWQPPGSDPALLPGQYLVPALTDLGGQAPPLPPAPPLMDARLGDDTFALSIAPAFRNAQVVLPPTALPWFDAAPIWQVSNGCGNAESQFDSPRGVAIDPVTGRVYVADTLNARVVELEPNGALGRVFSDGQFQEPVDLEFQQVDGADAGNLLVLDAAAQQIFTLSLGQNSTVTPLPLSTSFYRPRGFDADVAGNLLVADTGGGRLVLLNLSGQVVADYGDTESILGKGQPADAAIAGGRYWAITAEDGRLWRMETSANDSGSFTAQPRSDTLNGPHLASLPDGRFFLSDPTGRTIFYHAPTGEPRARFPVSEQFTRPVGIDAALIEGQVQLAVTDSAACAVSLWQVDGLR